MAARVHHKQRQPPLMTKTGNDIGTVVGPAIIDHHLGIRRHTLIIKCNRGGPSWSVDNHLLPCAALKIDVYAPGAPPVIHVGDRDGGLRDGHEMPQEGEIRVAEVMDALGVLSQNLRCNGSDRALTPQASRLQLPEGQSAHRGSIVIHA